MSTGRVTAPLPDDGWLLDLAGRSGRGALEIDGLEPLVVDALEHTSDAHRRATYAGLLEGIRTPRRPLVWPDALPDEDASPEQARRAGVLSGRLLSDVAATRPIGERDALVAVSYAAALAAPQGQRALGDLTVEQLVKAHLYACILTERHGHELSAEYELTLFGWLCAQAATTVDDDHEAKVLRLRAKRRERTRPSGSPGPAPS
jgi:hypothetical protein